MFPVKLMLHIFKIITSESQVIGMWGIVKIALSNHKSEVPKPLHVDEARLMDVQHWSTKQIVLTEIKEKILAEQAKLLRKFEQIENFELTILLKKISA